MEFIIPSLLGILIIVGLITLGLTLKGRQSPNGNIRLMELKEDLEQQRAAFVKQIQAVSALQTEKDQLLQKLADEKMAKEQLTETMSSQFESLAHKILDQQSESLKNLNAEQIGQILNPLKDKIKDFQSTIRTNYEHEAHQRTALKAEIESTMKMNEQLSQEARNLTKALTGDKKTQGNFGELKLEKVLESAGLQKGKEYSAQVSLVTKDGKRQIPDYTVNLPENRSIIIDSKVTLNSWVAITECDEKDLLPKLQKDFFSAINKHVDTLHKKEYQAHSSLSTVDFVLMYIPFECTYQYIYEHKQSIITEALEKGVIIASSSSLLTCLKTINSIWRKEYQDRNAKAIAEEGGKLYEKFVGFVDAMQDLGGSLNKAQDSYDKAYCRLVDGRGNLVSKAEGLKKLGAKTNKNLPETVLADALDQEAMI